MGRGNSCKSPLFRPLPETFKRVEVRVVSWQRVEGEAQLRCGGTRLETLGSMPGCAVPNDRDFVRGIVQPFSHALQELDGMFFDVRAVVLNEARAIG